MSSDQPDKDGKSDDPKSSAPAILILTETSRDSESIGDADDLVYE